MDSGTNTKSLLFIGERQIIRIFLQILREVS